ncbi:aspartate-semialdehyde dehydrogenase [Buchnera aphidicola]|uniref:aspartate-semialdehyde dehydrogenase n=1 Tax=Buchnera aphidicola TaxID=9 RepID=UPI0031B8076A
MKKKVGFIGWRGMVGSVLMDRMKREKDFNNIDSIFFSTSQIGLKSPNFSSVNTLQDAYDIDILRSMDVIVSCQGGEYTSKVYYKLRDTAWNGYWIDAASTLRMINESVIVLDPINLHVINSALENNVKTFVGGNCTVSLMLMAIGGLFSHNLIKWILFSTYQAASGAGSKHIIELLQQMGYLYNSISIDLKNPISSSILDIERKISFSIKDNSFPKKNFLAPLAGNVLPWIDLESDNFQTKEEWKVQAEANKILNTNNIIPIDGTCVRVGTIRCHSQSFVIKLKKDISYDSIIHIIKNNNPWVRIIPNDYQSTINFLTPIAISGTLDIAVGRIRQLTHLGSEFLSVFTVGDQLLWGAAEPLRRVLKILINR